MNRRYVRVFASIVFTVCTVWWVVFGWWLPIRVEESIHRFFDGSEVEIDDLALTWGSGTIEGIRLSGKSYEAFSPDVLFTYSPLEWCFEFSDSIDVLQISNMRLRSTGNNFSGEALWQSLEKLRMNEEFSVLESLSIKGEFFFAGIVCPFELQGVHTDFREIARFTFTSEVNATLPLLGLDAEVQKTFSGDLEWALSGRGSLSELELTLTLASGAQAMIAVLPDEQRFAFLMGEKESPELSIKGSRLAGKDFFSGDWNSTLVTADLVTRWPILALFNLEASGGGVFTWNPDKEIFETGLAVAAEVSSFLFREAGIVKGEVTAHLLLDQNGTLVVGEMASEVSDQLGERFQLQSVRPWRVGREKAYIRLVVDDFRLARFSERLPAKLSFSGQADLEFDESDLLARFKQVALRKDGENWAILSGLADASLGGAGDTSISFAIECEPGQALLRDVFPEQSFGDIFGRPEARGSIKLAGAWQEGALEIATLKGSLSTTMGERRLGVRALNKTRLIFPNDRLILAPMKDEDSDVFELSAVNLPLDGLLNWEGGRFQGDLFEGNGTVFFKDGRLGFRCNQVQVENVRILHGERVLAENLNLIGSGTYEAKTKDLGVLALSGLRLSGDDTDLLLGKLNLSFPAGEKDLETLISEISSSGLAINLTRLPILDLPTLPNLAEGLLTTKKLKLSLRDGISLEMDASLFGSLLLISTIF